jgi:hypothetical protein
MASASFRAAKRCRNPIRTGHASAEPLTAQQAGRTRESIGVSPGQSLKSAATLLPTTEAACAVHDQGRISIRRKNGGRRGTTEQEFKTLRAKRNLHSTPWFSVVLPASSVLRTLRTSHLNRPRDIRATVNQFRSHDDAIQAIVLGISRRSLASVPRWHNNSSVNLRFRLACFLAFRPPHRLICPVLALMSP